MAQNEPLASPFALSEGVKASEGLSWPGGAFASNAHPSNNYQDAFHGNATPISELTLECIHFVQIFSPWHSSSKFGSAHLA